MPRTSFTLLERPMIESERFGISQLRPFFYTAPTENQATLNEKREVDLSQPGSDLDP